MGWISWLVLFVVVSGVLLYHRASVNVFTLAVGLLLLFLTRFSSTGTSTLLFLWGLYIFFFGVLRIRSLRYQAVTRPALAIYKKAMPTMSRTEKEALSAGTVGFEGQLFCGNPDWDAFLASPPPRLSAEEKAFIDGPVDTLCSMLSEWDILQRGDLPPEVWQFMKDQGFFGLIIPKSYGGLDFSACAQSQIFAKIYGCSPTAATTVSVPNSLGPAELLLHYGTEEQKNYYLPRLARGEEIPCFALTGPDVGSDASAMPDIGIVCRGMHEGKEVIGVRLDFNKRYITLAPVATVVGLAFRLQDPEHLLGNVDEPGITCALIPRHTEGVKIGRRHLPMGVAFQNGPIQGKNVFIPLDWIIGGPAMAGQGWRMLMECLAAGRAVSLPSASIGGAKMIAWTTGAYARIRSQFGVPIAQFEGIQEALARIAGNVYTMDAARLFTATEIDAGQRPAVASAIVKHHVTELGRKAGNDSMDVHGGKGICLGPDNYVGSSWQTIPIAITVEGANILTRCLIIFGQGAMRCHPWIYPEFEAASLKDPAESLEKFDRALMGHMGFTLSNLVRALWLGLTAGRFVSAPKGKSRRYFQQASRFSAAFAFVADVSLLLLGGALKRKESLSARLGDILSQLYLLSAVLKHYVDEGKQAEDYPLMAWAARQCLYQVEQAFDDLFRNYPSRFFAFLLRGIVFPFGRNAAPPSDRLGRAVANLMTAPTATRARLADGVYATPRPGNMLAAVEKALHCSIAAEPAMKILRKAIRQKKALGATLEDQAASAFEQGLLTKAELNLIQEARLASASVIGVNDFSPAEVTKGSPEKAGKAASVVK